MPSTTLRYSIVDAFTSRPFAGNSAAVVMLTEPLDESLMQLIAREMNLSETAFLLREGEAYSLRWFTPTIEVDLCGHATLAAAHALWADQIAPAEGVIAFTTRSGRLAAMQRDGLIELDFPRQAVQEAEPPTGLIEALDVTPRFIGRTPFDWLVQVSSEDEVRKLTPDFVELAMVNCRGVIVTAKSADPRYDFVSRFFAPAAGIDEDPVTGSAHCALADFWTPRLNRTAFFAYQASPRGGEVHVRGAGERVVLGGAAVTCARGELFL